MGQDLGTATWLVQSQSKQRFDRHRLPVCALVQTQPTRGSTGDKRCQLGCPVAAQPQEPAPTCLVCRLTSGTWPSLPKKAATAGDGGAGVQQSGVGCRDRQPAHKECGVQAAPRSIPASPPPCSPTPLLTWLRAVLAGDKALKALLLAPEAQRGEPVHRPRLHIQQVEEAAPPRQHNLRRGGSSRCSVDRWTGKQAGGQAWLQKFLAAMGVIGALGGRNAHVPPCCQRPPCCRQLQTPPCAQACPR